jgi:hypothetical protein
MRSVELEAKRLDAIEQENQRRDAIRRARAQETKDDPNAPATAPTGALPAPESAPPLPPPIDIRPAPGMPDRRARKPAPVLPRLDNGPTSTIPTYDSK